MRLRLASLFLIAAVAPLNAQGTNRAPSDPPLLIQIVRGAQPLNAHPFNIMNWDRDNPAPGVLALDGVTGHAERWLIEGFNSFAALERFDRMLAGTTRSFGTEAVATPSIQLAIFVPIWSNRAKEAYELMRHARYYSVTVCSLGAGFEKEIADNMSVSPGEFWNMDRPALGYRVLSGSGGVTSVVIVPLGSLAEYDEVLVRRPRAWFVTPKETLLTEHMLLRLVPEASIVDNDFVETDPDLWRNAHKR